jgi:hypothetical protein
MDLFLAYVAAQTTRAINNPKAKTKEVLNIQAKQINETNPSSLTTTQDMLLDLTDGALI